MKTLPQIKDEIVQERGYKSYEDFEDQLTFGFEEDIYVAIHLIDEVAKRFAKQAAQKALEDAAERASLHVSKFSPIGEGQIRSAYTDHGMGIGVTVFKQSILSTPLIIE